MNDFEEFGCLEDAEEYIRAEFKKGEDELYMVSEYEDCYLVFLDEYDVEGYLAEDYQANCPDLTFENYISDMNIYIYITEEEKNQWVSRYKESELVFDDARIYKKKIQADAEYDIRVSIWYY